MASEQTRRIKIVSDGTQFGSKIIDAETGANWTQYIESVDLHIDGLEPPRAVITAMMPLADILVDAEFKPTRMIDDLASQLVQANKDKAALRGLVEEITSEQNEPVVFQSDEYWHCLSCHKSVKTLEINRFPHAPECPWLQARAYLAEHPAEEES